MSRAKIRANEKIEAVERYMKREGTMRSLASEYGVHHTCMEKWISLYKLFGPEGMERPQVRKKYSTEVKKAAVKSYLEGRTQQGVCEEYKIRSTSILQGWLVKYGEEMK